jgi:hypothetical protein
MCGNYTRKYGILEARAEILQKIGLFFGRFEDTKLPL